MLSPRDAKVTSWLSQITESQDSTTIPDTSQEASKLRWPHGVVSGGTLIDMLESLSATITVADSTYTLWLKSHYIEPFGRVDRLDGLVVQQAGDTGFLVMAYERYIEVVGSGSLVRRQKLWVPGLEPAHELFSSFPIPQGSRLFYQKPWRSIEAFFKDGKEMQKKGIYLGLWKDEAKWERIIWTLKGREEDGVEPSTGVST